MFRDLLANESAAPSWQELVRTYRRLEARGEIRGGRFVSGVAGEQYALPEAIPMLRLDLVDPDEAPLLLPATDPLNFTGRMGQAPRVPAVPGQSILVSRGTVKAPEPAAQGSALPGSNGQAAQAAVDMSVPSTHGSQLAAAANSESSLAHSSIDRPL
jgi:ATP-dependent Lhr-like helicase